MYLKLGNSFFFFFNKKYEYQNKIVKVPGACSNNLNKLEY